jgi:hypothetical protein
VSWRSVLVEKLTVAQLADKIPSFYENPVFTRVFTAEVRALSDVS